MWDAVRELVAEGVTILLTTQYLDEADHLADRIAVLDRGRIVAEGSPEELKRRIGGGRVRLEFASATALARAAAALEHAEVDAERLALDVPGDGSVAALRQLLGRLDDARLEVEQLSVRTPDLDDVFFAVTGRGPETDDGAETTEAIA